MTGIPATEVIRRAGVPFRGMDEWPVDCVVSSEGMGESGERIPTVRLDESVAFVALRAARVGLFELTLDGELLLDHTFLAALGYDPPVYIEDARAWGRALVHPDDLVRVGSHRDAMLAGKLPRTRFEYRLRASSGEFVWVEGVFLRTPTSVVGTIRDISDRVEAQAREKQRERDLRDSEERLRTILTHAPVMIDSFDDRGRCTLWNHECEKQLGYDFAEMQNLHDPMAVFYPEAEVRESVLRAIVASDGKFNQYAVRAKDGSVRQQRWANFRLPNGEGISVGYDITELVAQADELRRSNKELEEFAHVLSHDLQAPLRQIRAFIEMIREESGEIDPEVEPLFVHIERASERMTAMIRDILSFSRAGHVTAPPAPVDLGALAQAVVDELQLELDVHIGELPTVAGYEGPLHRLFQNLLENAERYAAPGRPARLEISAEDEGPRVRIDFRDNGIGVDPRFVETIFGMFRRVDTKKKGTGIGLAVCRKIARLHGGDISVESTLGEGSTFQVILDRKAPYRDPSVGGL